MTRQKLRVVDDSAFSASFERLAAQVDRHRLIAERRIEHDAEVRELADRGVDVARVGVAEDHRVGQLGIGRQIGARQRRGEALRDQRFEPRLAVFANRDLGAQLRARVLQLALDVGVAGIELGGELVFDQRLFELAGRGAAGARW